MVRFVAVVAVCTGLFMATGAGAVDLDALKAKTSPAAGSYAQAELCAATFLYESYLAAHDPAGPDHDALSEHAMVGAHLWVPIANKLSPAPNDDEHAFLKAVLIPDLGQIQQLDGDTFGFYVDYCTAETDKLTK